MSISSNMGNPPAGLLDLPDEVVLDHLLPNLPLDDLTSVSVANKQLHRLATDESLWRHKVLDDFSFSPSTLIPATDDQWFRHLYLGLRYPRAFLWGSTDNSRLGDSPRDPLLPEGVIMHRRSIDSPMEIRVNRSANGESSRSWKDALRDGVASATGALRDQAPGDGGSDRGGGIVDLQAGGWSFTARDMDGGVWVWGQLDGLSYAFRASSWENKNSQVPDPTRLPLPCKAEAISAGRRHLLVLDQDNLIWELTAWGRAYHHTSVHLTAPSTRGNSPEGSKHIVQVSAGWSHSACLTSSGDIIVWYPFAAQYADSLTPEDQLHGPGRPATAEVGQPSTTDNEDRQIKWGTVGSVTMKLDDIPLRPVWEEDQASPENDHRLQLEAEWDQWAASRSDKELAEKTRVVKIASGADFIVALRSNGEVWLARLQEDIVPSWEFMPYFSSPTISHISAQHVYLTSYSSHRSSGSMTVRHVRIPEVPRSFPGLPSTTTGVSFPAISALRPDPLPALQEKGVIQVALGDYHFAALTSKGEVYTWGEGSHGELGLGRTPWNRERRAEEPRKVDFGIPGAFAFAITAAGWHTGALILGSGNKVEEPQAHVEQEDVAPNEADDQVMPGQFPTGQRGAPAIFRIGFAGRGSRVGQAAQRAWQARAARGGASDHGIGFGSSQNRDDHM